MYTERVNTNASRRCVQCFVEYPGQSSTAFLVCETCQKRGVGLSLGDQSFEYKRTADGRVFSERHSEILRKMGQGRLDPSIQILDVNGSEWRWVTTSQSKHFAATAIKGSKISSVIAERKDLENQQRAQQKWSARLRFVKTFVGMTAVLGLAYTGWEKNWFVIDADPFAVEQGADLPIPDGLQKALSKSSAIAKVYTTEELTSALMNKAEWPTVETFLRTDLSQNIRQGTELLQWLQLKMLMYNPTVSDNPFPAKWLQFALSLHAPEDLRHRVTAMWHLLQGDLQSTMDVLNQCTADPWCRAYKLPLEGKGITSPTALQVQIFAEHTLSFADTDSYAKGASEARRAGLDDLSNLLTAENALQEWDSKRAAAAVANLQDSPYGSLRLKLWNQRLNPSMPITVKKSMTSPLWKTASIQTRGGWALEQAGAWLQADDQQANQRIEEWVEAGEWFEGDFENALLPDRFQLVRAQSSIYNSDRKQALEHLGQIQSTFTDPLLNFWLGIQWVQVDSLRNAIAIADSMPPDTPHHWMLKVVIAVQSNNADLLTQALDGVARTDISLLTERTFFQTWVPPFNWNTLLAQAEGQFEAGNIQVHYGMVLEWLKGNNPNGYRHADGWATGWMVRAQYAYSQGRFQDAHVAISRFRRVEAASVAGEILSQLVNSKAGRGDIAKRELTLIAQRERSLAWGHWLSMGFTAVDSPITATEMKRRWYPELPKRNVSVDQFFLFEELLHD